MTRKDFIIIADALYRARPLSAMVPADFPILRQAWANTVLTVSRSLADTNPRFDRARFHAAAGLED